MASLGRLAEDLISEAGDTPVISRCLVGKLWFIFTQMLAEADAASTNLARSRSTAAVLGRLSRAAEHVAARAILHPGRIRRMAGSLRIVRPFQPAEEDFECI